MKKSEEVMRAQKRKKIHAVNSFGGKCQICDYNKCVEALEFHHIDETGKEASPSYIIMRWAWERVKRELEKCVLVCANCHREIHAKKKEGVDVELKNYIKPWIKKNCDGCSIDFDTKDKEQKFCSTKCSHFSQRKVKRPTKEELKILIDEKVSWLQMGKMFGVSDNAVRKWAKKYELIK